MCQKIRNVPFFCPNGKYKNTKTKTVLNAYMYNAMS